MRGEILLFLTLSGLWSLSSCEAVRKFHYVTEKMTWSKAQSYCRNNYHDLASLLNMEDNSNLLKNRELHMDRVNTARAWIGLYDDRRNWTWSLNSTGHHKVIHFTNWYSSRPNNQHGNQICTYITPAGYWFDASFCDQERYSVCYNGSAYFVQDTQRSWFEAQKYCRDQHMDLASVMDKTENLEITKNLRGSYPWIGLYRKPWAYWSEQLSVNFTHWDEGKPTVERPVNKAVICAAINTNTGKWGDLSCATKLPFVCQEEAEQQARLKVKISSEADMNDPEVLRQLLQQVHAMLEKQGMLDFKLHWTQRDGNIFHKEEPKNKN